jgi:hypothetical protein
MKEEVTITIKKPTSLQKPRSLEKEAQCPLNVGLDNSSGERRCFIEVYDFIQFGKKLPRTTNYHCPRDHQKCPYLEKYTGPMPKQNTRYAYQIENYVPETEDQTTSDHTVDPATGLTPEDLRIAYRDPIPLPPKPEDGDGEEVYTLSKF